MSVKLGDDEMSESKETSAGVGGFNEISSKSSRLEPNEIVDEYLSQADWKVKENSNVSYSLSGLMLHATDTIISNYTLQRVYPKEVTRAHKEGAFHIHDLGMGITGYCFDEKTRILTDDGLKYFNDLNKEDKVATIDTKTKELVFQKPEKYQVYDFKGDLLHFSTESMNLLVTPEHELLHMTDEGTINKVTASEVGEKSVIRPPKAVCFWNGENGKLDLEKVKNIGGGPVVNLPDLSLEKLAEFIGWYIAEGNVDMDNGGHRISISQVNKANQKRIAEIMNDIGLNPSISEYHVTAHSKQLYNFLNKLGISDKKYIPKEFKNADKKTIEKMLKALFKGDGTFDDKGRFKEFYSNSKNLIEDVAECLIKTGRWASIRERRNRYELTVSRSERFWYENEPSKKEYDGKVYDVTVPNGTVLVEREGKFMWSSNCAGWSLGQLLVEGLNGVHGRVACSPAKHLDTALLQIVNFLGATQNEFAGAQAFSSVDTYLAPFVREDGMNYQEVKQAMQTFMFNLNSTSRWGGQTLFTNITLDWTVPKPMKGEHAIVGGDMQDHTYEDYQEEMNMINRALIEVMLEGDMNGRPFTFPIPTYNVTSEFPWDSENSRLLMKMTAKYGLPYFQNFVNSDLNPEDVRSMCCRLQLDKRELRRNVTGGLFGSGEKTGSLGVVTINMAQIGYLSENKAEFFDRLDYLMNLAKISLEKKRGIVEKNMERGLMPYSKRYLGTMRNHFSTIGLNGMNEAALNLLGVNIASREGHEFAKETLDFMRDRLRDFQKETGNLYNLEATPAEGTCYRFARIDKRKYPDIITAGDGTPYYTNSTQLPSPTNLDLFESLEHQEPLQSRYTGGTVFHIFLGERLYDGESSGNLLRKVCHNTRLPYVTLTPTYSICQNHGYITGEHPVCPSCGEETEVYSRVVGYYRPVKNWNEGKQEEFKDRPTYEWG